MFYYRRSCHIECSINHQHSDVIICWLVHIWCWITNEAEIRGENWSKTIENCRILPWRDHLLVVLVAASRKKEFITNNISESSSSKWNFSLQVLFVYSGLQQWNKLQVRESLLLHLGKICTTTKKHTIDLFEIWPPLISIHLFSRSKQMNPIVRKSMSTLVIQPSFRALDQMQVKWQTFEKPENKRQMYGSQAWVDPLLYRQTAGCTKSFQSLVFVLTQLHFVQWSSFSFCLPSLILQWPARIFHFYPLCTIVKLAY